MYGVWYLKNGLIEFTHVATLQEAYALEPLRIIDETGVNVTNS